LSRPPNIALEIFTQKPSNNTSIIFLSFFKTYKILWFDFFRVGIANIVNFNDLSAVFKNKFDESFSRELSSLGWEPEELVSVLIVKMIWSYRHVVQIKEAIFFTFDFF